ncbi:MAG: NUDIX hydrolase, partial [Parcubacteria group bacterium GW2011_GWF1_45_5]
MARNRKTAGAIIEKDGKFLLVKRNNTKTFEGYWGLPGGNLEEGENFEDAVKREIKEEVNLDFYPVPFRKYAEDFPQFSWKATAGFFFGKTNGNVKINGESSEFGWFLPREIKKMELAFNHKKIMEDFMEQKSKKILPKIFNSKILEARKISSDIKYIKFSVPGEFEFTPGQYLSVSRISDGKKLRTPYSIASSPGKGFAEFFIRIIDVGKASSYMGNLKKGDEIELFGPAGKFVIEESSKRKDLFFISNGTGITAFLSMISSVLEEGFGKKIILLAGFRNENEILCEKRLINLGKKFPNLE